MDRFDRAGLDRISSPVIFFGENSMTSKLAYERPELTNIGSLEVITQGASSGTALDATFPVQTPFSDLTFS